MGTSKSCSYTFEKKSVKLFSNKFWEKSKGFIAITWKLLDRKKKKKKKKKMIVVQLSRIVFLQSSCFHWTLFSGCFSNGWAYVQLANLPYIHFEEQLFLQNNISSWLLNKYSVHFGKQVFQTYDKSLWKVHAEKLIKLH